MVDVGFYGKLPSHGDFLRRRVSDAFVSAWDGWLQECMAASRSALGDRWLDVYLTSPVWRFAGAAGSCGPSAVLGLLAPSVDRVGRYFPFAIVAELPAETNVVETMIAAARFLERGERLVIDTLEADTIDFDEFDERVRALADDLAGLNLPPRLILDPSAGAVLAGDQHAWQIPIGSAQQLASAAHQLLGHRLALLYDPVMIWCSEGSARVEPCMAISSGLPSPESFAGLIDGSWPRYGWSTVPARFEAASTWEAVLADQTTPIRYRSAGMTDVGRCRQTNQDAFVERPDLGLWVVADGLGGHTDGGTASRMVCDAFEDFSGSAGFDELIAAVESRILAVNDHLVRTSGRAPRTERSGSTVVALLTRGAQCAVLWAGDSRAYRWREGRLVQLTRDHNLVEAAAPGERVDSHIVTRAVGIDPGLTLDLQQDDVRPGDRFLLCSDGLNRVVPDAELADRLRSDDIGAVVAGLIQRTLEGGAPDNVTVVIVEAYADTELTPPA